MALAHESRGPGVLIDEKTEGLKSRGTVPLSLEKKILIYLPL
jgi:hypothetical protein